MPTETERLRIKSLTSFRAREMFDGRFDLTVISEHDGRTDEVTFHDVKNFDMSLTTDKETRRIELTIYK